MPLKKSDRFNFLLIAIVIFLAYISFQIVRPFMNTILTALLVAFIFYPLYSWLEKHTRATIAAFIMSTIILLLIVLPTYFAVNTLSTEARYVYLRTKQVSATGSFFTVQCTTNDFYCLASKGIDTLVDDPQLNLYFRNSIGKITDYFINVATKFILYLPEFLLHIFIVFFILYYAFKESDHFIKTFKKLFPGGVGVSEILVTQIKGVVNAVVWGSLIVALLQAISALIGFWIFEIPSPFLWSLLIGLVALIPMIGAISVWFPLGIFYLLAGIVGNNNWSIIQGVFLLVYGFFIISGIEHVLKPKIISKWGNVHPVLVIIGALGGITMFGAIGFVIGPLVLALAKTVLEEPRVRGMFGI